MAASAARLAYELVPVTVAGLDLQRTFLAVTEALAEAGVAHAFIGALPVLAWGSERATTDLRLVVTATDAWSVLADSLRRRGIVQRRQIGPADGALPDVAVFFTTTSTPVRVDVFIAKTAFERAVIDTARAASVLGASRVRLATPEASIIYKLLAQRPRDIDDIESIFAARAAAGSALDWGFLDAWAEWWGIVDRLAPYAGRFRPGD
jgi:hypothetical protein